MKDEIYLLINRKHQEEWKKQKYEVALENNYTANNSFKNIFIF